MAINSRHLHHTKSFRIIPKRGVPQTSEGSDGDLTLRITTTGLRLYAKYGGRWYNIGGQALESGGSDMNISLDTNRRGTTHTDSRTGKIIARDDIEILPSKKIVFDSPSVGRSASSTNNISLAASKDILAVASSGMLLFKPGTGVQIDRDTRATTTATQTAMKIDYDHLGISASGQTITGIGLDLDMNCESVTHVGTVNQIGIDIDMVAAADGTQTNTGIDISCTGADTNTHLKLSHDADNFCSIRTIANGATTLVTEDSDGAIAHLTLDVDGDIILDSAGEQIYLDTATTRFGSIDMASAHRLKLIGSSNYKVEIEAQGTGSINLLSSGTGDINFISADDITIDAADSLIFDSDGTYITKKDGTEFSAANSAYAGMILGYTDIGLNEAHASISLTTSYVVPTDEFSVSFVAPPSGNVLIEIQIQHYFGTSGAGDLYGGLSTANATSGYSTLALYHEKRLEDSQGRYAIGTVRMSWTLTGLTAGSSYEYWAGFKVSSTTGTPALFWGANVSGRYPDFIMKATALPATITT